MSGTKVSSFAPFVLVLVLLGSMVAGATGVIIDSSGFESPLNTAGDLTGQDALINGGPGTSNWLTTAGSSNAIVQSLVTQSGTQALQIDRAPNSDQRWAITSPGTFGSTSIVVEWHMRIATPDPSPGAFGPFFGVEVYDDSAGVALLGSFGVDAATREILYQQASTGFLSVTGDTVNYDEWNYFRLSLDFETDEYEITLNGSSLHTEDFVDGPSDGFSDVNLSTFAASGDSTSLGLEGTAYFDNFAVSVPEPSAPLLALSGLAVLVFQRRR